MVAWKSLLKFLSLPSLFIHNLYVPPHQRFSNPAREAFTSTFSRYASVSRGEVVGTQGHFLDLPFHTLVDNSLIYLHLEIFEVAVFIIVSISRWMPKTLVMVINSIYLFRSWRSFYFPSFTFHSMGSSSSLLFGFPKAIRNSAPLPRHHMVLLPLPLLMIFVFYEYDSFYTKGTREESRIFSLSLRQ